MKKAFKEAGFKIKQKIKMPCNCEKKNKISTNCFIKHPQYTDKRTRLQTFYFPFHWPPSIKQTPCDLADSGFFYEGLSDVVTCFTCGGKLHSWRASDDVNYEHLQWFPNCKFINKQNIDEVDCRFINKQNLDEVDC